MSAQWPPRKDFYATYAKYAEMRGCAEAELMLLLAKRKAVGPTTPNRTKDALEIDIRLARQYVADLDAVMRKFAKALCMLSRIRGSQECALFARLVIECAQPKDVAEELNLAVSYVYKMRSRFRRELSEVGYCH